MRQLTVFAWNINQQSKNGGGRIPNLVIDEIENLKSDIICLTEYVKGSNHDEFCNELKSFGYTVFADPRNIGLKNEILIAIKADLAKNTRTSILPLDELHPNFLHLETKIDDEVLHIIGLRVQISFIDNKLPYREKLPLQIQDSKERMVQINHVINYIKELSGKICLIGDFNNNHYFENQTIDSWRNDMEFLQNYYSYPLLVKCMKNEINLKNHTPTGKINEVYSWVNQSLPHNDIKRYIRNDHLFTNLTVLNVNYNWNFLKNPEYKNQVGYPDHAILSATVSL